MASCSGIRADGGRCRAQAIADSSWCFNHHPDYEQRRRRRASKGGRSGGRGRPQAGLAQVKGEVREVIEAVRTGKLEKSVGAVVFQGYGVLLRAEEVELRRAEIITPEDLTRTMGLVVDVLRRHVTDRHAFAAISRDFEELTQGSRAVE